LQRGIVSESEESRSTSNQRNPFMRTKRTTPTICGGIERVPTDHKFAKRILGKPSGCKKKNNLLIEEKKAARGWCVETEKSIRWFTRGKKN